MPSFENSASATLNFSTSAPLRSSSISLAVLYSLGLMLNTDFFATKNLPSDGSIPAKIAGAPSHLTVILILERAFPANISLRDCKKLIAALPPGTPLLMISSSRCSRCKFFPALSSFNCLKLIIFLNLLLVLHQHQRLVQKLVMQNIFLFLPYQLLSQLSFLNDLPTIYTNQVFYFLQNLISF